MGFRVRQVDGSCAEVADAEQWQLSVSVYPDGSCRPHVLSELARASLAAARLDDTGTCTTLVSSTVPSTIAQTSVAAE